MAYIGKTPTPVPLTSSDIVNGIVTGEKLNADVISSQTALAVAPADTDEFLISDAGVLKRLDASLVGGGLVLQVVSNTQTSVASTTASSFEHATNCPTLNITPAATSSKILLIASFGSVENSGGTGKVTIFRDSTNLGDSSNGFMYIQPDGTTYPGGGTHFLDSPSTTSQVTYQIRIFNSGGTFDLGRGPTKTTLTAIEIGA